jgi:hypothetical protein
MPKIKKSDYIKISRTLLRNLYRENCFGKGSLYLNTLKKGLPKEYVGSVELVLESLVKQQICGKKKKEHGWKYYLNIERLDKIKEIIKEKGDRSLFLLFVF